MHVAPPRAAADARSISPACPSRTLSVMAMKRRIAGSIIGGTVSQRSHALPEFSGTRGDHPAPRRNKGRERSRDKVSQ